MPDLIPIETITAKIYIIRNTKVILDRDLAQLYQVETRELKQAVKRNIKRFPDDFMFILSKEEFKLWRSQIVISSWGGLRHLPMAFTEQGVAMLSSVLKSEKAIAINIQIMRAFISLKQMLLSNEQLKQKIEAMESKYDKQFQIVFSALRNLIAVENNPKRKIGF